MADRTAIEWTEATWNPVTGCTKVSAGCKFCYAERITERWGQKFSEIKLHPERLNQPLKWRKPRRIFVNSMSDLFHENIPDDFIEKVFDVMLQCDHIFQVLTKRPERMRKWVKDFLYPALTTKVLGNIWLGVSVENQEQADRRIPPVLETPAAVRFLSVEPLLGPIELRPWLPTDYKGDRFRWVIVGGESGGPSKRALVTRFPEADLPDECAALGDWWINPEALGWVRSIRDQCVAAGVPFFFKQWGGPTPKSGGRILDGRTWDEYPIGSLPQ